MPRSTKPGTGASRTLSADLILLFLVLAIVYVPTVLHLPMRSTGDEKTYIAQALEMARHDTWFKQTLFELPDYYKGPLFYALLRGGILLFGPLAPAALDYMNAVGYAGAAAALAYLMHRRLGEGTATKNGATLLAPAIVVLSCGGYAHALASQMEALLVAFYAVFLALLGCAKEDARGWKLRALAWMVAGAAGWLKSPVHAVLLGCSALLFWLFTGELRRYSRRGAEWGAALLGVITGVSAYLPAWFYDHEAFVKTYLWRETFGKGGGNGVSMDDALMPFFTAHLLPWTPLLVALLWIYGKQLRQGSAALTHLGPARRLFLLAAAVCLPTVVFFVAHPYRNGVYILPILPAVAVALSTGWALSPAAGWRPIRAAQWTITGLIATVALALTAVIWRLSPWPSWWGQQTSLLVVTSLFAATLMFAGAARVASQRLQVRLSVIAACFFFTAVARVLIALNDHDRAGVTAAQLAPEAPWFHVNLNGHLWSETGLLNSMLEHPVRGVHSRADLLAAARPGQVFLVPDASQLAALTEVAASAGRELRIQHWPRWRIHGEAEDGEPTWLQAWRQRSLSPLERDEFLVTIGGPTPPDRPVH